jgi:hypothetical protein
VLVVHPVSETVPATIKIPLPPSGASSFELEAKNNPGVGAGVTVSALLDSREIFSEQVDADWETLRIPLPNDGRKDRALTLKIAAIGWKNENTKLSGGEFK